MMGGYTHPAKRVQGLQLQKTTGWSFFRSGMYSLSQQLIRGM